MGLGLWLCCGIVSMQLSFASAQGSGFAAQATNGESHVVEISGEGRVASCRSTLIGTCQPSSVIQMPISLHVRGPRTNARMRLLASPRPPQLFGPTARASFGGSGEVMTCNFDHRLLRHAARIRILIIFLIFTFRQDIYVEK